MGSVGGRHRPKHLFQQARLSLLGETAVVVEFGERIDREILECVWALARHVDQTLIPGMIECVPAYTTVTIFFDPDVVGVSEVEQALQRLLLQLEIHSTPNAHTIEIPVCYDEEFGPDLAFVAERNGMTVEEVIAYHSRAEYLVYLMGFAPGFPYLGGMPAKIAAPRLESPRLSVPAGSVGIAGEQTGIYPMATPGGWRLIGRTPVKLFRPQERPPSLLMAGDAVRFRRITRDEFAAWPEDA